MGCVAGVLPPDSPKAHDASELKKKRGTAALRVLSRGTKVSDSRSLPVTSVWWPRAALPHAGTVRQGAHWQASREGAGQVVALRWLVPPCAVSRTAVRRVAKPRRGAAMLSIRVCPEHAVVSEPFAPHRATFCRGRSFVFTGAPTLL